MFDVGFSEILVIAVVALLVLGPERLPKAARFAGLWVRRARAQWNSVKAELENELADEELRRDIRQAHAEVRDGLQETRALIEPAAMSDASITETASPLPQMTALRRSGGASTATAPEPGTADREPQSPDASHDPAIDDRTRNE